MIDMIEAERFGPLGDRPLVFVDLGRADERDRAASFAARTDAILVGVDRQGSMPDRATAFCDTLLTTAPSPPRPWTAVVARGLDDRLAGIAANVASAPFAASLAMHLLRLQERLGFDDALTVESLAYSTLLGGSAFRRWRQMRPQSALSPLTSDPIRIERADDLVTITLAQPATRNGMCARMRDALHAALGTVLDDPSGPRVRLRGEGRCFSTGGALDEFGTADDLALADAIRRQRGCARLLHRLGDRAEVVLHGACIGSGIEIAAAARVRIAEPNAFFQLPELRMGLIPGAGGTVSISRAIGRHRAAFMILSGRCIDAATAMRWNLVQRIDISR